MYALKQKGKLRFECISSTRQQLEDKLQAAISSWKAFQPKGEILNVNDFWKDRERVRVTIELL